MSKFYTGNQPFPFDRGQNRKKKSWLERNQSDTLPIKADYRTSNSNKTTGVSCSSLVGEHRVFDHHNSSSLRFQNTLLNMFSITFCRNIAEGNVVRGPTHDGHARSGRRARYTCKATLVGLCRNTDVNTFEFGFLTKRRSQLSEWEIEILKM